MILSAHQPAYLPWLGYLDKIARSDIFVYLDNIQFEKNSYINRNKIKTAQGPLFLTIPVKTKGHMKASLESTEIDNSQPWRAKHLKSIEMSYRKALDFNLCYPKIQELINFPESNLAEYCFRQLLFWCDEFGIKTKIIRASAIPIKSAKSELILDLCKYFCAEHYLSGALGRNYLLETEFDCQGIKIEYQDYQSPVYSQLGDDFVPNLGIIDSWMNRAPLFFCRSIE